MKRFIVSAWSRGKDNAKNYPFMNELCKLLREEYHLIQIGVTGEDTLLYCQESKFNLPLTELESLVKDVGNFIAIDNFLHHLAYSIGVSGTVLWGPSDPNLFGYATQNNIIKSREFLRKDQFGYYKDYKWEHTQDGWLKPEEVISGIRECSGLKHSDKDTLCQCVA